MPLGPDPPPGPRLALVVATGTYTDPGLRRLRAPAQDADDLAQVLADPSIGGFTVTTVIDQPAQRIRLAIEDFLEGRGTGDLLLVYLSCHGLLDARRRLYFAAADTRKDRLGATGVEAAWVLDQLEHCRARRQVLILDSCFSGAFAHGAKGEADVDLRDRFLGEGRGRVVLTASTATEYSFEGDPTDAASPAGSVFTAALVHGLRTGDADIDHDGHISVDDAYAYVFDQIQAAGAAQTPQRWLYGAEGRILLARSPAGPTIIPAPLPESLRAGLDSPHPGIRIGAVTELGEWLTGSDPARAAAARRHLQEVADTDIPRVAQTARTLLDAGTTALGGPASAPPRPAPPKLVLSDTVIDLGRLPQHGRSPERQVRIGNAGGEDLNAQAAASASWLKLRQAGDELAVAMDTSTPGEYEGTVTVDSDGGTATIRVHARVDPAAPPASEAAAATYPGRAPETHVTARAGPQQTPAPATVSPAADAVPLVTETPPSPANSAAGQTDAEPDVGHAAPPGDGEQGAAPPPRDDHPHMATADPGPGEKTPRAPRPGRGPTAAPGHPVATVSPDSVAAQTVDSMLGPASAANLLTANPAAASGPEPATKRARPTRAAGSPGSRHRRRWLIAASALALLAAVIAGFIAWPANQSQSRYYVAADSNGEVVIDHGSLSSIYQRTGIPLDQVPSNYQQTVRTASSAGSLAQVQAAVASIRAAVQTCRQQYEALRNWAAAESAYQAEVALARRQRKPTTAIPKPGPQPASAEAACAPSEAFGIPASALSPSGNS